MKNKIRFFFAIIAVILILSGIFIFLYLKYLPQQETFDINRALLKSVITENENLNTSFRIVNYDGNQTFKIETLDLEKIATLSENNFILGNGKSKEIGVSFLGKNTRQGVYVGSFIVKSGKVEKILPVILEVQSFDPYFAINLDINPSYKKVLGGEKIISGVNFFNLKDMQTHSVEVEYKIIDKSGGIVASERQSLIIGSKLSTQESMNVPENIAPGNYAFAAILDYGGSVSTSTYLFSVVDKKTSFSFINVNFFQVFILILLFIITAVIIYILIERNEILSKLEKQQKSELDFYSSGIEKQKNLSVKNARSEKEKKEILNEFKDAKNKIIRKIKDIQKKQVSELSELKEKKDKEYLENKIKKWRKEIYPKALKSVEISSELKRKLGALERAYSEGYISEKSYKKGKSRIESEGKK